MTEKSSPAPGRPAPYGSARDLPTYQEMAQLVQGAKLLTRVIARDQRQAILDAEKEMNRLADVVDDFYIRLGPRNWVFHDSLNPSKVESILAETSDAKETEASLIELYQDTEATRFWLIQLRSHEGLRVRLNQIERAHEHYHAAQFDSCTLQLIAVMDGFVNDFEPGVRKGLAAREPDEMAAWDSVVGHHQGLTHVMRTFRKTIKKRVDEEVFDVYRHGIVHGMVVNFDNAVVATKAWNMLFAVADWATATSKAAQPAEPAPTWRDTWSTIRRQADRRRAEQKFEPTTLTTSDPSFATDDLVSRAGEFLKAWENGRWSLVADFMPQTLRKSNTSDGESARFAKDVFGQYDLSTWSVTAVSRDVPGGAAIRVNATVNGAAEQMQFRMILEAADGNIALPDDKGATWRVGIWAPRTYFAESA